MQADIMQALILNESLQGATAMFNEAREQRHQQLLHQKQQQNRKRRRYNPSVQASFPMPAFLCEPLDQSLDMLDDKSSVPWWQKLHYRSTHKPLSRMPIGLPNSQSLRVCSKHQTPNIMPIEQ